MAPVLLIGLDPRKIAGFDPAPVELAIAMGHKRFVDAGIEIDTCTASRDRVQHESDDEPRRSETPDAITLPLQALQDRDCSIADTVPVP